MIKKNLTQTLFLLVLLFSFSNITYAQQPLIETRTLSKNLEQIQKESSVVSTSTEWRLYQRIIDQNKEIAFLRDKVEQTVGMVNILQKEQTNFQSSIRQQLVNQEDVLVELVTKIENQENKLKVQQNKLKNQQTITASQERIVSDLQKQKEFEERYIKQPAQDLIEKSKKLTKSKKKTKKKKSTTKKKKRSK